MKRPKANRPNNDDDERIKRGDRVVLHQAKFWPEFAHRKKPVTGQVTKIDGGYILVRPSWCHHEVEQYDHELSLVRRGPKF